MSDTKTKAELLEMLAEAVRNTQPQPVGNTQPEPARDAQPPRKRKTQSRRRPQRRSAQPKLKTFRHLLAASSGVDNASEVSMIDKMTKDRAQRPEHKAFLPAHNRKALTEHEKAQNPSKRTTNDCELSD